MKSLFAFTSLLLVLTSFNTAQAYRPISPHSPYYFKSENNQHLVEIIPILVRSRDSKHLLVKKSQTVSVYKKGDGHSWKENSSFPVGRMHLIKEALIPNHGKVIIIRIDENPTFRTSNKENGIFIYSSEGKKLKSYSHLSVFGQTGIFRNMKLNINNTTNQLIISNKEKTIKLALPK